MSTMPIVTESPVADTVPLIAKKLSPKEPKPDFYSGVRWSAASKYGAQGLQFIISMVMARLLAPEYFGLLGMATVITGFVKIFRNVGFNTSIIQRKEVSDDLLSTLFWVNLGVYILVGAVVVAVAPAAGWMYGDPRVTPIIAALSITFLFAGFAMIPSAILTRQMQFKKLAIREIGGVFVSGCTGITLAYLGWGVWALVAATLASSFAEMVLINLAVPFLPRMVIDRAGLKECLGFGLNLTGFSLFNYFARQADNLIIGLFLGPIALGYYSFAYKLMLLPRDSITSVVTRVLFPKLSKLQHDDARLSKAFLQTCGAIAFITFPMMAGLGIVAERFVLVVLGEKWMPAVPIIWILAPLGALQSVWVPIGQIYLAKGNGAGYFRFGIANGLVLMSSFFAGIPFGAVGVAASYSIVCLLWIPTSYFYACKQVEGLSVSAIWQEIRPAALTSAVMAGCVWTVQKAVDQTSFSGGLSLLICVATGVCVSVSLNLLIRPPALFTALKLIPVPVVSKFVTSRTS